MPSQSSADKRFASLVEALSGNHGVTVGSGRRGFGSAALQVHGRIFAMVTRDCLVFKMPRNRVCELIESGDSVPFDAGKGRPMKEWVAFETIPSRARSIALARESLAFVGAPSVSRGASESTGMGAPTPAQKLFEDLAAEYVAEPGAERRRMFGSDGLRSNGSFFAFLSKDRLVVKVAPKSAQALIAKGHATTAEAVSPTMREWLAVPYVATTAGRTRWRRLVAEARAFIGSRT